MTRLPRPGAGIKGCRRSPIRQQAPYAAQVRIPAITARPAATPPARAARFGDALESGRLWPRTVVLPGSVPAPPRPPVNRARATSAERPRAAGSAAYAPLVAAGARTDAELLAAHRAGDGLAFGELVARLERQLWNVAARTLHRPDDASDVVQETLVAAYRRADTYRGDASVRTWFTRILINACMDRMRGEQRRDDLRLAGRDPMARRPDLASELATRLSVEDGLAELPVQQRVAVVLVDVQGWPVAEVAQVLDVPVGTVKSRCARGRARLAVLLGHLREEVR